MPASDTERAGSERRLAAIMFTDIVGYTALMGESEERGLRVRERHREVVRPLVAQYHGESIEARGDESLSLFPSALDAVNCALAVQEKLEGDPETLRLHIGIHQSDIELRHGEVIGDGVNIASRICGDSDGSAPLISDEVQHAVQNQSNLSFESLGEHEFKNVPRPIPVFRVTGIAQPPRPFPHRLSIRRPARWLTAAMVVLALIGVGVWLRYRLAEPPPIRSIAVLPLENLSGESEQDYFSDGMTEALIGELAKIGALRVISRTSVMQYKEARKPLPAIARELNVRAVVEGSVLRADDRVRIALQLIDADADTHLWAQSYERDLRDVLALQGEIAREVARAVAVELTTEEQARLRTARPVVPAAHDAYLRGLPHLQTFSPRGVRKAVAQFEEALAFDPSYAEAHEAMARAYLWLGGAVWTSRGGEALPKARDAALRALQLAPDLGSAHATLGTIRYVYEWNWREAEHELARALALDPGDPWTLHRNAIYKRALGHNDEALELARRALVRAPFDPFYREMYAIGLIAVDRIEEALGEVRTILDMHPGHTHAYWTLSSAQEASGRDEQAYQAFSKFLKLAGTPGWYSEAYEAGYRDAGLRGAQRSMLRAMIERAATEPVAPAVIGMKAAQLGETDLAFHWWERAFEKRDATLADPLCLPLIPRDDPRGRDLLRRMNYPGAS